MVVAPSGHTVRPLRRRPAVRRARCPEGRV